MELESCAYHYGVVAVVGWVYTLLSVNSVSVAEVLYM